jgi:hypothetical protein
MAKRDRQNEEGGQQQQPTPDQDQNAGYPGNAFPEGTLAGKGPAATDNAKLAGNEPDGDASGRPGSATAKHVDASTDPNNALPAGQVRVKALKTVLHGGMAYTEGQTFGMDEKDFEARKDRGEVERA